MTRNPSDVATREAVRLFASTQRNRSDLMSHPASRPSDWKPTSNSRSRVRALFVDTRFQRGLPPNTSCTSPFPLNWPRTGGRKPRRTAQFSCLPAFEPLPDHVYNGERNGRMSSNALATDAARARAFDTPRTSRRTCRLDAPRSPPLTESHSVFFQRELEAYAGGGRSS